MRLTSSDCRWAFCIIGLLLDMNPCILQMVELGKIVSLLLSLSGRLVKVKSIELLKSFALQYRWKIFIGSDRSSLHYNAPLVTQPFLNFHSVY